MPAKNFMESHTSFTKEEVLKALDYIGESTCPSKEINVYANGLLNELLVCGFIFEAPFEGITRWFLTVRGSNLLKHCTPPMTQSMEDESFKNHKTAEMTDWLQRTTDYSEHNIRNITYKLVEYSTKLEFADTFRVADVSRPEEVVKYMEIRTGGCCGFEENLVSGYDGELYLVGCNYGH
jgi:hypothetical protein